MKSTRIYNQKRIFNTNTHFLTTPCEYALEHTDTITYSSSVEELVKKITVSIEELRDCTKDFCPDTFKKHIDTYNTIKFDWTRLTKLDIHMLRMMYHHWETDEGFNEQVQKFIAALLMGIKDSNNSFEENKKNFSSFIQKMKVCIYGFNKTDFNISGNDKLNNWIDENRFSDILSSKYSVFIDFITFLDNIVRTIKNFEVALEFDTEDHDEKYAQFESVLALLDEAIIVKFKALIETKLLLYFVYNNLINNEIGEPLADDPLSSENYEYSLEDAVGNVRQLGADAADVGKSLSEIPQMITEISRKFKMFRMKSKNHFFYKKYLGRIDHLYERYANEARVKENKMNGDPVKILKEKATQYIERVSDQFIALHGELMNMSKQIERAEDPKVALGIINKYLRDYKTDLTKANEIPVRMMKATKDRVAQIILEGNRIYGYTRESIIAKKVPPPNHTIVSLFVDNPHEVPEVQAVSDIFESVDSFKLIAANQKKPVFDVSLVTNNLVAKGVQRGDLKYVSKASHISMNNVNRFNKEHKGDKEQLEGDQKKQMSCIWKGLKQSTSYMVKMKKYVANMIKFYFVMMCRIDRLCKTAVVALLYVERSKVDKRFLGRQGTGLDRVRGNQYGQYRQYDEPTGVDITRGQDYEEEPQLTPRQQIKKGTNEIRQSMKRQLFRY